MTTGRRPKPTHLKVVQGNPGKRPLNTREPQSTPLAGPPKGMSAQDKAIWCELVEAAPPGVLKESDRFMVELAARLLGQVRSSPVPSAPIVTQLRQCLSAMGMDPSARSRLVVAEPAVTNPFADI